MPPRRVQAAAPEATYSQKDPHFAHVVQDTKSRLLSVVGGKAMLHEPELEFRQNERERLAISDRRIEIQSATNETCSLASGRSRKEGRP